MRESTRRVAVGAILASICGLADASATGPGTTDVVGMVVDSTSRWGYGGAAIVTETTVETSAGERIVVQQLGGRVGDIAMRVTHSPPIAPRGALVWMRVTEARSLDGRSHRVLATVVEMSSRPAGELPFVRTTTDGDAPLYWESGCAQIALHDAGAAAIPAATEVEAIAESLEEWQTSLAACSYLDLRFSGITPIEPAFDGYNVIRFREDRWCRPPTDGDPEICHDPAAAALTFLTFAVSGERNGAMLDADIEVNGVDFGLVYAGTGSSASACPADIPNTMVHELGHFLGLDHTCWDGIGPRTVDDSGAPAPSCDLDDQLPAEVRDATMYAFQDCSETLKASLTPDDIAGACSIYPAARDPGECTYPVIAGGFCSTGAGPATLWWVVLALIAIARAKRSEASTNLRRGARRRCRAGRSRG